MHPLIDFSNFASRRIEELTDAVRVPRRKERSCDGHDVCEDRHTNSKHESRTIRYSNEDGPCAPATDGMLVHMPCSSEHTDESELSCGVTVETSCNQEVWQRNTVCRLRPLRRQTAECRRHDIWSEIDVHDDGKNNIEGCSKCLQRPGGLLGVLWVLHLGYQDEEHEVSSVRKHGIRDCKESIVERSRLSDDYGFRLVEATGGRHANNTGDEDAEAGNDGHPGQLIECAWEGENQRWYGEDACGTSIIGLNRRSCVMQVWRLLRDQGVLPRLMLELCWVTECCPKTGSASDIGLLV